MAQLLQDRAFVASFLEENRRRLGRSYGMLTSALTKAGIPFTPAVAAMFVWVDLRHLLAEPTSDAEWALWNTMVDDFKLLLTPGVTCHATEPGFFRMCYAWCPAEALPVAVARLQVLQGSKKAKQ
jgi:DNA-binding transcriptional MocR family regulator